MIRALVRHIAWWLDYQARPYGAAEGCAAAIYYSGVPLAAEDIDDRKAS